MQPWTPPEHIITFGYYLNKHQKLCKAIGIPISDTDMYSSKHFKEEEMMKYDIFPTDKKDNWAKTSAYFTTLYAMRKVYSEDPATEIGFKRVTNITHISRIWVSAMPP